MSKTQLHEIGQSRGFLGRLLRPLLKTGLCHDYAGKGRYSNNSKWSKKCVFLGMLLGTLGKGIVNQSRWKNF